MDTEPKAVAEAPQEPTEPASSIEYYPAEGAEEEAASELTGGEPEAAAGAPVAQGPEVAQATGAEPIKPTPPRPEAAPPDMAQYRAALEAQQQFQQQQAEELNRLRLDQELSQLRATWVAQGTYDETQIQQGLAQHRQFREREMALDARARTLEEFAVRARADDQAKITMATILSQRSGMPFADLMRFNDPVTMEAKSEAFQAQAELAKMKLAKVKPTKLASGGPGNQGASSMSQLRKRYAAGEALTPEQVRVIFPNR